MPNTPDMLQNSIHVAFGVAAMCLLFSRLRRRLPGHVPPVKVLVVVGSDSGMLAGVSIRSKWARLSRMGKIGVCAMLGIGTLGIVGAFLAGAPVATLMLFAALLGSGAATLSVLLAS